MRCKLCLSYIKSWKNRSYLLTLKVLDKVLYSTVAVFFNDYQTLLSPNGILYDKVLVVYTDAAPYVCKAIRGLRILYPKIIYVTYLAHGLHRVTDLVNNLQTNMYHRLTKLFRKRRKCGEKFWGSYTGYATSIRTIITGWRTKGLNWK